MDLRSPHRISPAECDSLRAAANERQAAVAMLKRRVTDEGLARQLDIAARLFDDVSTLFLAKVEPAHPRASDEQWLRGADAHFRAACVFLDGLRAEIESSPTR
ncbi:MAG: hypothetical protein IT184_03225 [Acidobacteria bacterium]|nr:hypothetical protein [Acidobacteriota bacterium]